MPGQDRNLCYRPFLSPWLTINERVGAGPGICWGQEELWGTLSEPSLKAVGVGGAGRLEAGLWSSGPPGDMLDGGAGLPCSLRGGTRSPSTEDTFSPLAPRNWELG